MTDKPITPETVRAAEAAALREAAEHIRNHVYVNHGGDTMLRPVSAFRRGVDQHHKTVAQAILALITPEAQTALERALAAERERCAKAVEALRLQNVETVQQWNDAIDEASDAIRAQGGTGD
jgi:hypothetical protein